ncbi:XRE family transcriptional regulator [Diplocloster hominis]|uniref:XRE family transcriptional regulator n=1 Tax=Diplocloster hominis TaxID=3079010 RepID=UPI0031BB40C0
MELTFGKKIREARQAKGFTQKQLAEKIKAKHNSVSDWENDKNKPDPDTIELLCGVLEITPNYLLAASSNDFTPNEKLIIEKYRLLDDYGKETMSFVLDREVGRIQLLKKDASPKKQENSIYQENPNTRLITYYYRLASAGTGQIVFDMPPSKYIEIPDLPEFRQAAYAIGVNGNSMEPIYNDGDMLLVEMTEEIDIGEIGIFIVDGDCFVKKLGENVLISLNPKYPNIKLCGSVKCMGKVIGKL